MSLYTFKTGSPLPSFTTPGGLRFEECTNLEMLARMGDTTINDVQKRIANDHVAFIAYLDAVPAAFGWMARGKALVGELNHELILPARNRYLWNFRTMEAFRVLNIYPALIQYIIRFEEKKADRFWIIHAPENTASLRGIRKAGFDLVGKLYYGKTGATLAANTLPLEMQWLLIEMSIKISNEEPFSCWNCSSPYLKKRKPECCCMPFDPACIGNNLPALYSLN